MLPFHHNRLQHKGRERYTFPRSTDLHRKAQGLRVFHRVQTGRTRYFKLYGPLQQLHKFRQLQQF